MGSYRKGKGIFISWAPYATRSDSIAAQLGIKSEKIHYLAFKVPMIAPIKYLLMAARTLCLLIRIRPSYIMVMNPPIFAVFTCYLHARLHRIPMIIDTHHGAFTERRWLLFTWLHRHLARKARVNIVTSERFGDILANWKADYMVIPVVPYLILGIGHLVKQERFSLAVVSSFSYDEPLPDILKAAAALPEIKFYVTGDNRKASKNIIDEAPQNVVFTGFLPWEDYIRLLAEVHGVLCLTTELDTMQNGAAEAVTIGTPVITTDSPLMRKIFGDQAVLVKNNSESIIEGILRLKDNLNRYQGEISELRDKWKHDWQKSAGMLYNIIDR